ncbi:type II toxin-antitoxin system RelE/ParE family toxin [Candidatus Poribacteria bacterium]|nr:type II toxin-antitoxin system RelE/ParE family toxin [Candidatus Poribacteria bacterium]
MKINHVDGFLIQTFKTASGKEPFTEWLESINNKKIKSRIKKEIDKLQYTKNTYSGNRKRLSENLYEIKISLGPGYRIYFTILDNSIAIILCGGTKDSQTDDIKLANTYLKECKEINEVGND